MVAPRAGAWIETLKCLGKLQNHACSGTGHIRKRIIYILIDCNAEIFQAVPDPGRVILQGIADLSICFPYQIRFG